MTLKESKEMIAREFADHRATFSTHGGGLESIRWQHKDGGSIYCVDYLLRGGHLFVSGDMGSAVYHAYGGGSVHFWATTNLDYFMSKCEAAPHRGGLYTWDEDVALAQLKDWLDPATEMAEDSQRKYYEEYKEEIEDALTTRGAWSEFLGSFGYDLFGSEWWESIPGWGDTPSVEVVGHWVGIRMAYEQLAPPEAGSEGAR